MMATVAGIGTAGVPGGSLPLVVLVLEQLNIPAESIGIILGVDRLLDMSRTTVNVVGDLTIAACVDEWKASRFPPKALHESPKAIRFVGCLTASPEIAFVTIAQLVWHLVVPI